MRGAEDVCPVAVRGVGNAKKEQNQGPGQRASRGVALFRRAVEIAVRVEYRVRIFAIGPVEAVNHAFGIGTVARGSVQLDVTRCRSGI